MMPLLLLAFLREISGATFFLDYAGGTQTLVCNASDHQGGTNWWFATDSLQMFQRRSNACCICSEWKDKCNPCYTKGKKLNIIFPHGQIVACKTRNEATVPQPPLFTKEEDCETFDFFIVAKTTARVEQKILLVKEKTIGLECKFELEIDPGVLAVYWIKEMDHTACLYSASNEGNYHLNISSYNQNCCIDANIANRTSRNLEIADAEGRHQNHKLTITDVTPYDSGIYLCVVTTLAHPQNWTIVTNVSVQVIVQVEDPLSSSGYRDVIAISLGIIGGIVLIIGTGSFIYWKKKSKAKPSEQIQRSNVTLEAEHGDCSPYAVTSRNDIDGIQSVYALVGSPGTNPSTLSSLPKDKLAGENLEVVYSVVNKDRE